MEVIANNPSPPPSVNTCALAFSSPQIRDKIEAEKDKVEEPESVC